MKIMNDDELKQFNAVLSYIDKLTRLHGYDFHVAKEVNEAMEVCREMLGVKK